MREVSGRLGELGVCIVGGAGFIGSHFVDALLGSAVTHRVTLFDNFSSGRERHFEKHRGDARLRVIRGDASGLDVLTEAVAGHDLVIHLASNPDIARAISEPQIDFYQGTLLTNNVVEAMRRASVGRLLYASGSGVYGERGDVVLREDLVPLRPVSTYGASKLAGEALIASYCAMFGLTACAFRFANVVGARQTHGVGPDFMKRLREDSTRLRILGDGRQSKSYVHVSDVVTAVLLANASVSGGFHVWNVATNDAITVTEIAELAAECLGIDPLPQWEYTGGDRGWKGDVPVVRLDASRIKALGWKPRYSCHEAIRKSLEEMAGEFEKERVGDGCVVA
ncbi:MAG: NAD-dependent epimerase/dehydratase family protein [Acidobacteriaceae bacterium]